MRIEYFVCNTKIKDGLINYYILEKELNTESGFYEYGIKLELITFDCTYCKTVEYFCDNYDKIKNIIYTLRRNKVTPLGLYDVLIENFV